jgi:DNA replication protein DnaC
MERIGTTLDKTVNRMALKRQFTVIRNDDEPTRRDKAMIEQQTATNTEMECSTCKNVGRVKKASANDPSLSEFGPHTGFRNIEIPCPVCSPARRARQSEALQTKLVDQLFGGSQIPHKARGWSFDTFPATGDQEARALVELFVKIHKNMQDQEEKRGLWISGSLGRGKTGLSICALKEFIEAGLLSLFVSTPELMDRLRATFGKDSDESQDELLKIITEVPVLVLDDLGVEKPTPYVLERFYLIVDKRQSKGLYTIFTSNLTTGDLEAYWRPETIPVGFHPGQRVIERIREYCSGINIKGKNLRGSSW